MLGTRSRQRESLNDIANDVNRDGDVDDYDEETYDLDFSPSAVANRVLDDTPGRAPVVPKYYTRNASAPVAATEKTTNSTSTPPTWRNATITIGELVATASASGGAVAGGAYLLLRNYMKNYRKRVDKEYLDKYAGCLKAEDKLKLEIDNKDVLRDLQAAHKSEIEKQERLIEKKDNEIEKLQKQAKDAADILNNDDKEKFNTLQQKYELQLQKYQQDANNAITAERLAKEQAVAQQKTQYDSQVNQLNLNCQSKINELQSESFKNNTNVSAQTQAQLVNLQKQYAEMKAANENMFKASQKTNFFVDMTIDYLKNLYKNANPENTANAAKFNFIMAGIQANALILYNNYVQNAAEQAKAAVATAKFLTSSCSPNYVDNAYGIIQVYYSLPDTDLNDLRNYIVNN